MNENNQHRFGFNRSYFMMSIVLFLVELFIGFYVNDAFVRPYVGDYLVVILLYTLLRTFWNVRILTLALSVLVFSFIVEILQYFKLVEILGLGHIKLARIIMGTSFVWEDLLAYTLGIATVLVIEGWILAKKVTV